MRSSRQPPTPTDTPIYLGRVFDAHIGASADDSYAYQEYYRWRNAATEDDMVLESTNVGGLRFGEVEIPAGARIDAAYVEVHVYHSDDPRLYLYAEAADDAADFTARRPDLSNRRTAFARWEGDDIGEGWRRSPDIGSLIEETVDRPGWESGSAFVLLMQPAGGRYRFRQWDYESGEYAARLHVEYSLAATPTPIATPAPEVREVTIQYEYDPLNRLTAADYSTGEFFHYAYDGVGNRLWQETQAGANVYAYDAANRLVEVDGVSYAWSANGNLLDDGERTYTYDHGGRLSSVVVGQQIYTFAYNGLGDRLSQSINDDTVDYTLDLNAGLTQVLSDGSNTFLYGLSRVGQQGSAGWSYHLPDAWGSVRQMADPNAAATFAQAYEPYGSVLEVAGEARTPYGFAGEWMDRTGLVHLRARYYAPYFGAFIQPDPWMGSAMTSDTLHPYLYAGANPVVYRDPSGRCYRALEWMRGIPGEDTLCEYMDMSAFVLGAPMATPAEKALAGTYILGWATAHSLLAVGAGLYTAGTAVAAAEIAPAISSWAAQALAGQMAAGEAATLIAWTAATSELATSLGIGAELYLTYQALACGNPEAAGLLFSGFTLTGQSLVQNGLRRAADRVSRDVSSFARSRSLLSAGDADFFVFPNGVAVSRRMLQLQGTSPRVGNLVALEGATVEEWVSRIPADWELAPQAGRPAGVKFTSPDGMWEVRLHAPTTDPRLIHEFPNDPGVRGWVGRIGRYWPNYPDPLSVDDYGFVYYDASGNIGRVRSAETHIPIRGNPFLDFP